MPRIDPLQLLKCLSVLLAPNGGIKSKEEVQRLARFMAAGGWNLIHMWLSDAIIAKNWPLIQELLELLLMCPVDVERLKTNTCPKLIKGLSKDGSNENVRLLAGKLVEQWLRIVKGECAEAGKSTSVPDIKPVISDMTLSVCDVKPVISEVKPVVPETKLIVPDVKSEIPEIKPLVSEVKSEVCSVEQTADKNVDLVNVNLGERVQSDSVPKEELGDNEIKEEGIVESANVKLETIVETMSIKTEGANIKLEKVDPGDEDLDGVGTWNGPVGQLPVYKITIRDGKQVLAKVYSGDRTKKLPEDEEQEDTPEAMKSPVRNCSVNVSKLNESVVLENQQIKDEPDLKIEDMRGSVGAKTKIKSEIVSNENLKNKEGHKKVKDLVLSNKSDKKSKSSELNKDKGKDIKDKDKSKEKIKEKEKIKDKTKEKEKVKEKEKDKKLSDSVSEKDLSQADRDKATLAKLIPPTISKLGKIPKKPKTEDNLKNESKSPLNEGKKSPDSAKKSVPESKKNSISIEIRNKDGSRPKTVKKFNSKFRSTGLEEEVKPPPSRLQKKPMPLPEKKPVKLPPLKRPSPPREAGPLEKKMKPTPDLSVEELKKNEKPGSIKLIPSKPKPPFLQESDMFMDALTASSKKEPRKRKRRISSSKDSSDKKESGSKDETTPPSSPVSDEIKSPPIMKPALKFYQDTMEAEDEKESEDSKDSEKKEEIENSISKEEPEGRSTPTPEGEDDSGDSGDSDSKKRKVAQEEASDNISTENDSTEERPSGHPKGVLVYHKSRKGPKKLVRWKPEKDLETIKYFELDETERVNVTKNFMDMKQIERSHEREALMSRKMPQDDNAEEDSSWLPLIPIDCNPPLVEPGKNSREKDVQYAREKVVLQAIYFDRSMIPDFPGEPDMEIHATTDPVIIPLDDVTGNTDSVNDFTSTPWPEPKPMIIPQSPPPQYPLPQQQQPPQQSPQSQQQIVSPSSQFGTFGHQSFSPSPMFPNQPGVPNVANAMGVMMTTPVGGGSGDWRTGDGKVVAMGEMAGAPMEMYNQGGMPVGGMGMNMNMNINMNMGMNMSMNMGMNMGMPSNMPGDMNYNMMGAGDDMGGPGGPFPPQNYPMGGPPNMYGYQNSRGPGPGPGPNMGNMRGRGGRGGRGQWFGNQQGGGRWQGGSGSSGRGRGWSSRTVCKHFRGGYCRMQEKCPFLHPGVNGPPQF
ncbi:Uncharacterized protein GBIM_07465 [Gryllus bimaculatus]|nr:Uncharacterized protein GBIM_07465 [Gryllus bimaculatus]